MREFMRGRLSQQHGSRLSQPAHDGGIGCGLMPDQEPGVRRGGHVGGGNDVFDRAGHAMERPQVVTGRQLVLGRLRASERRIGGDMEERVDRLASALDAFEKRSRPVNRREFTRADERGTLGDAKPGDC